MHGNAVDRVPDRVWRFLRIPAVWLRGGWLTRRWTLARIGRGQSVSLASTPLDRRAGMASVSMDTAGVRPGSFKLRVDYLDAAQARELHATLARSLEPRTGGG